MHSITADATLCSGHAPPETRLTLSVTPSIAVSNGLFRKSGKFPRGSHTPQKSYMSCRRDSASWISPGVGANHPSCACSLGRRWRSRRVHPQVDGWLRSDGRQHASRASSIGSAVRPQPPPMPCRTTLARCVIPPHAEPRAEGPTQPLPGRQAPVECAVRTPPDPQPSSPFAPRK